ncbi:Peptidase M60, enhancin and enhancin-like [Mucilaginibacter lappiensis]|uniref:Peptidase M60 domain-containing protein n=1 Tax=Mucilaginibacter lappiensis TaxID=354630 RepID=A0ABR6PQP6_9SPHI|nr:M60 family metallopeptidase [Mucilaginibacter lappiensis]MBB6111330.1 hypothetical protein [Mucilaginibacter lappiensis]SIR75622.1 Peptidase M60, enhancin and enhancin-like [Mucilaginibacter lappiensis]
MFCKPYRLLLCFSLLLVNVFTLQAQDIKTLLLKHIDSLPMPPLPEGTSFFITINRQPEIIAMAMSDFQDQPFKANAIVSSTLGKGKVLLFGPSAYLKAEMLTNKDVSQLLKNALNWASPGNRTRRIAVTGGMEKGFTDFLQQQNATVYITPNFKLKKNTSLLVLNKDITDVKELQLIEDFITAGGTLLFASPYSDLYNSKDTIKNLQYLDLGINKLLAKAGLVNPNALIVQSPKYTALVIDSVPDYVQLKTLLPLIQSKKTLSESVDFFTKLTIEQVLKYNDPGAPVIYEMKQAFDIPAVLPVPSPSAPVLNSTPALKVATKAGYWFYAKQQDFIHHPEAKAAGYQIFPGDVPANALRVNQTVVIPVKVGTQGLNDPEPVYYRPHSTGLYVPAGEKVTITISTDDIKQHLKAQIGVHDDDLTHMDQFKRTPVDLTAKFSLDQKQIDIYSPYGGLLLINIADTSKLKTIKINVSGAVKAPYFKLGKTSEQEWNTTIRNNPAPWAELATDNIVLTVPSYRIRNLNNPVKLMQFWDEVMNADADLAAISPKRAHQERIIVDIDAAYGYMFTTYEKIVVPDDQSCEWMLNEAFIRSHGSWGAFHELGHRHQFWKLDFPGTIEVTENLFSMYTYDKVLHKGIYNHENISSQPEVIKNIKVYLANNPSYEKWCNDPFLALSMYIELINQFGWDAIKSANTVYRNLPSDQYPKNDQDKRDLWFTTISKATNSNLGRFFDVWKIPVSETAKKQVSIYKPWFPKELEGN